MITNLIVSKAIRLALLSSAGVALALPAAFAQDAAQNTQNTNQGNSTSATVQQLSKVEVTGTRILRTNAETAQPITIITAKQIKASGLTTIGDVLQNITQSGAAINSFTDNTITDGGQSQIDLRYFGANRVLVLVNGQRWMSNIDGTVDLNSIPASIVDHIEILQDGASAIYGSDAITGVINIITIKNFNGAQANAYMGMYDNDYDGQSGWDGKTQSYSLTIGTTGERSGVVLNASYREEDPVWANRRAQFVDPAFTLGKPGGVIYTAKGVFIVNTGKPGQQFGQATCSGSGVCEMSLINTPTDTPTLSNFKNYDPAQDNDLPWPSYLTVANETKSLFLQGHYDIADNLTLTTMGQVNVRDSAELVPPPAPTLIGSSGVATDENQPFGVGANNPYNPFHKDLVAKSSQFCPSGTLAAGPNAGQTCTPNYLLLLLTRNIAEGGNRELDQHMTNFSFRLGLDGFFDALGNEWDWNVGSNYGNAYNAETWDDAFDESQMAQQLDSPGVAQCNGPGQATKPAGDSVEVGGQYYPILIPSCVPMNLFGGYNQVTGQGSITPAMLAYSEYQDHEIVSDTMRDYNANITGSLFNLPAGPLSVAVGAEYLENDDFDHPDEPRLTGSVDEVSKSITQGEVRTDSEYVEFNIPLLSDVPLAKELNVDLANRWSQFKWAGGAPGTTVSGIEHNANATTARAQVRWQPTTDLLLRASWAQGFRVPDLSSLYAGAGSNFPFVEDPCAPSTHFGGWTPGTPLPAGCHGVQHTQPFNQIEAISGGNPSLSPEHAISRSAGFVYNPSWIPGFDFSADYYKIDLLGAIGGVTAQFIVDECYIQNNPAYCSKVTTVGNVIQSIDAGIANTGELYSRGVDVTAHYRLPATVIGDFSVGTNWTFVQSFVNVFSSTTSPTGWASSENRGLSDIPQRKGNVTLDWNYANWSAHWATQYIGALFNGCSGLAVQTGECTEPNWFYTLNGQQTKGVMRLGTTIYHDVSATYHVDSINTNLTVGILNLFNKQFPCGGPQSCGFVSSVGYRVPGRFVYASVGVKF